MSSLWFVVPAHGRLKLAQICLRQLRRTCDQLEHEGIRASAVVIACDENLDTARDLGFAIAPRDNRFLSRRFNDGVQLACDPQYNPHPADYVVPCGSDDWVDWRLFVDLPAQNTMVGFPYMSLVSPDASELRAVYLTYQGGAGIRIWPRALMRRISYRPAAEDLRRGCDTSILVSCQQSMGFQMDHRVTDPRQIVDWKSHTEQVNPYDTVASRWRGQTLGDPFAALADIYPEPALEEMASHYGLVPV